MKKNNTFVDKFINIMRSLLVLLTFWFQGVFAQTISDIDGNIYNTVQIGSQVWMQENLNVSRYRNGDNILKIDGSMAWQNNTQPAYTVYNNDPSVEAVYGKLYNWLAVTDSRGACPEGWKIPSDADWTILSDFLGGVLVAGGKMKEAGFTHWSSPNTGADNSSGFTALPAGLRASNGDFYHLTEVTGWWSSTEYDAENSWMRDIFWDSATLNRSMGKFVGFSCRCIKINTTDAPDKTKTLLPAFSPNPASNYIQLNSEFPANSTILIQSLQGITVLSITPAKNQPISVHDLSPGLYVFSVFENNSCVHKSKLLIIK